MVMPLPKYSKIKNRYCVGYFGEDDGVLLRLQECRGLVEKNFPGLLLYIVCRDDSYDKLLPDPQAMPYSEFLKKTDEFPYYRTLIGENPVEDLLEESGLLHIYIRREPDKEGVT